MYENLAQKAGLSNKALSDKIAKIRREDPSITQKAAVGKAIGILRPDKAKEIFKELHRPVRQTFLFVNEIQGRKYATKINESKLGYVVSQDLKLVTVSSSCDIDLKELAQLADQMGSTGKTVVEQESEAQKKLDTSRKNREARQQETQKKNDKTAEKATTTRQQGIDRQRAGTDQAAENDKQDDARLQKQADAKKERQDQRRGNDDRRRDQVQRQKDREQSREQEREKDAEKDTEVDIATTVATAAAQGVAAALNKGKDGDKEDDKKEKKEQMLSFQNYLEQAPTNSASANNIAGLGDDEPIVRGQARRMKDCSKCKGEGCAICTPTAFIRRASQVAENVMRQLTAKRIARDVMEQAGNGGGGNGGNGNGGDGNGDGNGNGKTNGKHRGRGFGFRGHGHKCPPGKVWDAAKQKCVKRGNEVIQNDFAEAVENLDIPAAVATDIPADAEPTTKTYAGSPVFKVSPETFAKCSGGRKKWARWSKTLNLEDEGQAAIRTYANKYPSRPIVLQCDETGDMKFLRFNRKGGGGNRKRRKNALPTPTDGSTGQIVFDAENESKEVQE